jgi:hypothetical protein
MTGALLRYTILSYDDFAFDDETETDFESYDDEDFYDEEDVPEDYVKARQAVIPVADRTEMYSVMEKFNLDPHGISYCLGMALDGNLTVHQRLMQPCYGEMRPYTTDESKPTDLYWPFPDGIPAAVSVNLWGHDNDLVEWFLLGETSPWRSLWKDRMIVTHKPNGKISGMILTDTMFDPTFLVQGLITLRTMHYSAQYINIWKKQGVDPFYSLCLQTTGSVGGTFTSFKMNGLNYAMPATVNFNRLKNSNPDLPEGFYFANRAAYRRVGLEDIWWDESEKTTHLFNDDEIKTFMGKPYTADFLKEKFIPAVERICSETN